MRYTLYSWHVNWHCHSSSFVLTGILLRLNEYSFPALTRSHHPTVNFLPSGLQSLHPLFHNSSWALSVGMLCGYNNWSWALTAVLCILSIFSLALVWLLHWFIIIYLGLFQRDYKRLRKILRWNTSPEEVDWQANMSWKQTRSKHCFSLPFSLHHSSDEFQYVVKAKRNIPTIAKFR